MQQIKVKFQSELSAAITAAATTAYLKSVTSIPTAPFMAVLAYGTNHAEYVLVSAITTATKALTIVRAQRSSTAYAHPEDTLVYEAEIALADIAFGYSATYPKVVASGAYGLAHYTTMAGGASEGLSAYFEGHLSAALTGHTYNLGSWINVDAISLLAAGYICTPFEGGIYAGTAQAGARIVFAGQHQAILAGAPASIHAWRLNVSQVIGSITALIAAANPESVGFAAGETASTQAGTIPIADIVGTGVVYINTYTTSA